MDDPLAGMAEGWRDWLSAWEEYRTEVDEYRALRRYDWWLLEGWRETHFATHASPPAVVFVTSRERPLRRLVATADQVLSAGHGREDAGPREGTHPAREQILFTSRDRIRAGDWTMERTPSLPPVLRVQPDVCSPRSVVYDMRSMFANRSPQPSEFALIPGGRDMQ